MPMSGSPLIRDMQLIDADRIARPHSAGLLNARSVDAAIPRRLFH